MADNVTVPLASGGVTFRSLAQNSGQKWPALVWSKAVSIQDGQNVLSPARDITPIPIVLRDSAGVELPAAYAPDGSGFHSLTMGDPFMCLVAAAAGPAIQSGRLGIPRITISRDLSTALRDSSGSIFGTQGNPVRIQFTGTTALLVSDGGASITVDSGGGPLATLGDLTISSGTVTVNAAPGSPAFPIAGMAAHGVAVSGNPVLTGSDGRNADPTAAGNGTAVRAYADTLGKKVMLIGAPHERYLINVLTLTSTTAVDILAAGGAGVRWVVTGAKVQNAHATIGTKVEIRDGLTVKIRGQAGPVDGGFRMAGPALFVGTANTAVTARCLTAGADADVTIRGYRISN